MRPVMASLLTIQGPVRYEVVRKIVEGGMGVIYEAKQLGAQDFVKRVAIKVIRPKYANQKEFIESFVGEARLVADLIHTNIVQTYHLGESEGLFYITMELIRGVNLAEFSQRLQDKNRVLPIELAVFIASRVCRGLAYAHTKTDSQGQLLGIVHRDISPKNVMIAFEGDVKLTDFGVAKARGFLPANEGEVIAGRADYMSPEQADFKVTDQRSDLFSVSVVLAHLVMGYNIFKGESTEDSRRRILELPIPDFRKLDSRVDDRLNDIMQRGLHRDLQQRYQTAEVFLHDLEYYIYRTGYGPTNETLGRFLRDLFVPAGPPGAFLVKGETHVLERTVRLSSIAHP